MCLGVVLVDVRTVTEIKEGVIPNSVHIEWIRAEAKFTLSLEELTVLLPDKSASLVVFCKSGKRAAMAMNKLTEFGYLNLTNGINKQTIQAALLEE